MGHKNSKDGKKKDNDVRKDEMSVDSFSLYHSTTGEPKVIDGKKVINSFDIYPEENSDTDKNHK